jgi:hypothetical protein
MKHFLRVCSVFILFGAILFSAYSQDINITGTVKDASNNSPIKGAKVSLKIANLSTTTNDNGQYSLTGSGVRFVGSSQNVISNYPYIKNNRIFFSVNQDNQNVKIGLYNILGKNILTLLNTNLNKGNYSFSINNTIGGQLFFVKITIGNKSSVIKAPFTELSNSRSLNAFGNKGSFNKSLALFAINDTLIVSASGYNEVRKGITSYTGTHDFNLTKSAGHKGTISFEMGSYSGTQYAALVILNDEDLSQQTVPVKISSNADPKGFTMYLKKDPTTAGQYADSVRFSIYKTDSAKQTIKVQQALEAMGDSIYAIYYDQSPVSVETTMVQWSGNTGQVGPGASMYNGLNTKIAINLSDPDLSDSVAYVTIKTPADTVGIQLKLKPVPFTWGSYTGTLRVSLQGSSAENGYIKVTGKDILKGELITIIYEDLTPKQTLYGGICTWRPVIGSLILDSTVYHGTSSKMTINLYENDILSDTALVTIKSKKDPTGITKKLVISGSSQDDRIFVGQVGFSLTASNTANSIIAVQQPDTLQVIYTDTTPDTLVIEKAAWQQ